VSKSGNLPDVFIWWGARELKSLVNSGKILKLDKYISDEFLGSIGNNIVTRNNVTKYLTFNNNLYGLPYNLYLCTLFANEEMFEKNGIDLPKTFDELLNSCYSFRKKGVEPIALAGKDNWPVLLWYNMLYMMRTGSSNYNKALEQNFNYDNESMISAVNDLQSLMEEKAFQNNFITKDYNEALRPVLDGKIPMILMGNWVIERLQKTEGELPSKVMDKMKPLKFPKLNGKKVKGDDNEFLGGAIESIVVNSKTKYKKEAVIFASDAARYISINSYKDSKAFPVYNISKIDKSTLDPLFRRVMDTIDGSKDNAIWWDVYLGEDNGSKALNVMNKLMKKEIKTKDFIKELKNKE